MPHYLELYPGGRAYLPSSETKPVRDQVAALARELGVRDRRRVRLDGTQHDEQLSLAVCETGLPPGCLEFHARG